MATSCGIWVIATRRAITAPTPPPMPSPRGTRTASPQPAGRLKASVVTMAIPMPIIPYRLSILLAIHGEHALRDEEAAEDVDRGEHQADETDHAGEARPLHDQRHADGKQRADHDHRGDRVRDRHERRMQRRRHRPHHVVADEDREHENRQPEHGRVDGAAGVAVWATPPTPAAAWSA